MNDRHVTKLTGRVVRGQRAVLIPYGLAVAITRHAPPEHDPLSRAPGRHGGVTGTEGRPRQEGSPGDGQRLLQEGVEYPAGVLLHAP